MSGDEPVTSPDQHKPTISKKASRLGAVLTIVALVAMALISRTQGGHQGQIANIFLFGTAGLIFLLLVSTSPRRSGLRSQDPPWPHPRDHEVEVMSAAVLRR